MDSGEFLQKPQADTAKPLSSINDVYNLVA